MVLRMISLVLYKITLLGPQFAESHPCPLSAPRLAAINFGMNIALFNCMQPRLIKDSMVCSLFVWAVQDSWSTEWLGFDFDINPYSRFVKSPMVAIGYARILQRQRQHRNSEFKSTPLPFHSSKCPRSWPAGYQ